MSALQSMRSVAPLLWSAPYREPVLEGFIASIGGLDGRLRRSVSAAMAQQLPGVAQPESLPLARRKLTQSCLLCLHSLHKGLLLCRAEYHMLLQGVAGACFSPLFLLLRMWCSSSEHLKM